MKHSMTRQKLSPPRRCLKTLGEGQGSWDVEASDPSGLHRLEALVKSRYHRTRPDPGGGGHSQTGGLDADSSLGQVRRRATKGNKDSACLT